MAGRAVWVAMGMLVVVACGGDEKRVENASSASSAPKWKFTSFVVSPTSGTIDKIAGGDGVFAPDGVMDLVFDAEFEGPAIALAVISTDDKGMANGAFSADTYVNNEPIPSGVGLQKGRTRVGIGIYESDNLLNAGDGALAGSLPPGKHKLSVHVSSKDAPKGFYKAVAVFEDGMTVASTPAAVK